MIDPDEAQRVQSGRANQRTPNDVQECPRGHGTYIPVPHVDGCPLCAEEALQVDYEDLEDAEAEKP